MINDIYATSMHGLYTITGSERVVEHGEWTYRGYGNAEIAMSAIAERDSDGTRYELRIHSVERQLDDIQFRMHGDVSARSFNAKIAGIMMTITTPDEDGGAVIGNLALPPDAAFDGPSPIWLIYMAMTSTPPSDRVVTAPVLRYNLATGEFDGGFYRFTSDGKRVVVNALDADGVETGTFAYTIADDGFVTDVLVDGSQVDIQRLPSATFHS